MGGKPKISARETYVLDQDEISRLDEESLTSVMRQVSDPIEETQKERDGSLPDSEKSPSVSGSVHATINELIELSISITDSPPPPIADNTDPLSPTRDGPCASRTKGYRPFRGTTVTPEQTVDYEAR
jgi:hypothetical protein